MTVTSELYAWLGIPSNMNFSTSSPYLNSNKVQDFYIWGKTIYPLDAAIRNLDSFLHYSQKGAGQT
jgi:hypothetical protein